jgi:ankyrin repeat protein|tara:strand:- start:1033 stop:1473 length:441 start_codon:yes stop_codon:yes gene_type:complete
MNKLSPLLKAPIKNGVIDSVKRQLKDESIINSRDINEKTPLMIAAENNQKDICELLIKLGADILLKDSEGRTALDLATINDYKELSQLLDHKLQVSDSVSIFIDDEFVIDDEDSTGGWVTEEEFNPTNNKSDNIDITVSVQNEIKF